MSEQIIFGFIGQMGSGKGEAVAYLKEKYGASTYRFSDMLRDALDRFYLPHTRDNLITISEVLRETFGEDLMAKTMAKDIEGNTKPIIVVEGIRRPADIIYLKKFPHFVLAEIFVDPEVRFERIRARGENADDATKTYEQFLIDQQRSTEMSILEVVKEATERINNNGTRENLYGQLDDLVRKYRNNEIRK